MSKQFAVPLDIVGSFAVGGITTNEVVLGMLPLSQLHGLNQSVFVQPVHVQVEPEKTVGEHVTVTIAESPAGLRHELSLQNG